MFPPYPALPYPGIAMTPLAVIKLTRKSGLLFNLVLTDRDFRLQHVGSPRIDVQYWRTHGC
jgi:hypothetical protein